MHGIKAITNNNCQITLNFKMPTKKSPNVPQITQKLNYSDRKLSASSKGEICCWFQHHHSPGRRPCFRSQWQWLVYVFQRQNDMKATSLLNTSNTFFKKKCF